MTPKSLLRHKQVVSSVEAFTAGHFHEVVDEPVDADLVRRVLLCSGKLYYELVDYRAQEEKKNIAIIRIEQLYPFPEEALLQALNHFGKRTEFVWVQEEPKNMALGPSSSRAAELNVAVHYVGRDASASPAVGSHKAHQHEQTKLVEAAISGPLRNMTKAKAALRRRKLADEVANGRAARSKRR